MRIGADEAVAQYVHPDGRAVLSIVRSITGHVRFIEETEVEDDGGGAVAPYCYWKVTMQSGLYETAAVAEREAFATIRWLSEVPRPVPRPVEPE